tara:strand:+ start:5283 stop:6389 length:1107 start_codon:yes stop_codon:yes gene_type:complete
MTKIGILTFHHEDNYGAVLQTYALQKYLQSQGCVVEIINFRPRKSNFRLLDWIGRNPSQTIFKWKKQVKRMSGSDGSQERSKVFAAFRDNYLAIGSKVHSSHKSLKKLPPNVDVLIVGSDQIWSPKLISYKDYPIYWLDFGSDKIKKIAYSASFGGEYGDWECYSGIPKWASCFSAITARERNGVKFLHRINVKHASWAPDPTFLLDWKSVFKINVVSEREKIGRFVLKRQNQTFANKLQKQLTQLEDYKTEYCFDINSDNLSPINWIKCISTLKFVITDSFHGTVFCIITNTPFITILWQGVGASRNDRVISLLEEFGLESRAMGYDSAKSFNLMQESNINWAAINFKINEVGKQGKTFLSESIGLY